MLHLLIPFNRYIRMRSQLFAFAAFTALALAMSVGCNKGKAKGVPDNGQLVGASMEMLDKHG